MMFPKLTRRITGFKLYMVLVLLIGVTSVLIITRRPPRVSNGKHLDQRMEQTLLAIYARKLKDIKAKNVKGGTSQKPCKDEPVFNKACVDTHCRATFLSPPEENLRNLLRRQYSIPDKYIQAIQHMAQKSDRTRISFVTATSANHFYECQALMKTLIENVFPGLKDFRFYVYDLGMKPEQVKTLKKHCTHCRVRPFPFAHLPPVVSKLKSYTWKPVVVQAHLHVSEFVFWMDSSVRFITNNLTSVLETVRERGMLISSGHVSTAVHTDTRMYDYFDLKPCQMSRFRELEGTFLIFHNNVFTQNAIVLPWLSCAFSPDCMDPSFANPGKVSPIPVPGTKDRMYAMRHRFDQSALTTILAKLYPDNINYVILRKNYINANKRGDSAKYFPED